MTSSSLMRAARRHKCKLAALVIVGLVTMFAVGACLRSSSSGGKSEEPTSKPSGSEIRHTLSQIFRPSADGLAGHLHRSDNREVNKFDGSATALTFAELEAFYDEITEADTALAARRQACMHGTDPAELLECAMPRTRLAVVVPFIPNQLDKVESYLHTGLVAFKPCGSGFASSRAHVDLIFSVRHQKDLDQIGGPLRDLTAAVDLSCYRGVYLTHAKLNERESNDYNIGPPAYFHNTLNSSWIKQHQHVPEGYSHLFWMEPDTLPVQDGWLEGIYRETQQMEAQGDWMRGSLQQHNMKMYGDLDRYHVNGNALYAVGSKPFRTFLRHARRYVPSDVTAFDYAIHVWRAQTGKPDRGHAYITQMVQHKFQETAAISNHPADLCPSLKDWSLRNPLTRVVHGNQVLQLLQGSKCCDAVKNFDLEVRANTELSAAYECLNNEMKAAWAVHVDDGNYERKAKEWKDEKTASEIEMPIRTPLVQILRPT